MIPSPRRSRASGKTAPNIYDVAREAKVSVFTVSAVINKKQHVGVVLKRRVEAAKLKLGYRRKRFANFKLSA